MSEIIQYVSLGIGLVGVTYSSIVHFLHKNTNKTNDINQTIKFQNIDQNINSIKELFQKIIKSNLFSEIKTEAKDIENQIKEKIEGITNFEYDKIKDCVQNEKSINRETVTKVSNMFQLSQNIQNHIETQQQQSNNMLQVRKTQEKQKVSIYELPVKN
ncbi:hypothetical protein ABPG74_005746 [Tetrahymena malaccensis]